MKKLTKIIITSLLLLSTCLSLGSCQLSNILGKDTETNAGSNTTEPPKNETEAHEPMNFDDLDLSQYMTLGNYKGFELSVPSDVLTDDEFRENINEILKSKSTEYQKITDRKTKKGDKLNIDFKGFMNGEQFSGGTASSQTIELKDSTGYISGFDADLYDVLPGTTVSTTVTFPTPYPNDPTKAGKEAVFEITVNYIYGDPVLPEYNDKFVDDYSNGKYKTVAEFEEYMRTYFQKHKKYEISEKKKQLAWEAFVKNGCQIIEIPKQQIEYYYYQDRNYYESYAAVYGLTYEAFLEQIGVSDKELWDSATQNAQNDVALYSFIKAENVAVSDEEYKSMLAEYADMNDVTPEYTESYFGKEMLLEYFKYDKARQLLVSFSEFTVEDGTDKVS